MLLLDGFVTSDQVPELSDNQFRKELERRLPLSNVKMWLKYKRGSSLIYIQLITR